ncbi:hypothetical protein, variant 1 [Aphanomyces astaci]|uniref:Uncharacterized protein n=1 Tax=Aphanomyces astaci TaxID=112090 RepID=W4GNE0_APHAT|nr:hypothetical protein, variant 1 [Aphanomyces astaci]ETV80408.1 hypothetical protein, variant 1 [Aphanomyces astaci]|eukprot:XP_009830332.1 hypothetical protein, variant 1 [Aphanomyces astaci]
MTVLDVMTTQLRACEEKLSSIQDYKENELTDLYRLAEEAINAMKAEQDAIEATLPQLADKERHGAMERLSRIDLMESNAKSVQDKLTQLHAHTGELCDLLEPQTTRLKHLETQIQYFQLLLEVETLSARAKPSAGSNGDIDALVAMAALNQSLSTHFGMDVSFQLNLRSLIKQRMAFLAVELQAFHTNALDVSIDALRWPQVIADTDLASNAVEVFRDKFTALVQVQLAVASVTAEGVESELSDLWAMQRLLQPLVRRFHFHFDTHVKTNDVSKPEWYLTHVVEVLRGHILFLESVVRPALARGLVESSAATRSNNTDGVALFIHGLLQPVCAKLKQSLPILNKALLCHTVDEVVDFEWKLRQEFQYRRPPRVPSQKTLLVLDQVAANAAALDLWLQVDLEYAQNFTLGFLRDEADVAWTTVADDDAKVTRAAYAIAATFDVLSKRFQVLSDPTHRYTYVAQVLKPWLYQCHVAIERFGQSQPVMSQPLVTTAPPSSCWRAACAAVNTAWFVQQLLREHDEVKAFVELLPIAKVTLHQASIVPLKLKQTVAGLSKSVLNHPLLETQEAKNVTHGLLGQGSLVLPTAAFSAAYSVGSTLFRSLQRPKESVVEVVRAVEDGAELDERESDTYTLDGSIFQNEWTWFQAGVQSMEEVLVAASSAAIRAQWGQYHTSPRWTEPAAVDRIVPDVSPEFTGGVALFRHHLVFAHASLNPSSFEVYWKALSKELDGHVLAIVLQLKAMSKNGRLQFTHDVHAVTLVLRPYTSRPDAYVRRLVEASAVLHMPTAKARVLGDALATQHKLDMASVQIQTMLEASQLHALTPSNVSTLLRMGA